MNQFWEQALPTAPALVVLVTLVITILRMHQRDTAERDASTRQIAADFAKAAEETRNKFLETVERGHAVQLKTAEVIAQDTEATRANTAAVERLVTAVATLEKRFDRVMKD